MYVFTAFYSYLIQKVSSFTLKPHINVFFNDFWRVFDLEQAIFGAIFWEIGAETHIFIQKATKSPNLHSF